MFKGIILATLIIVLLDSSTKSQERRDLGVQAGGAYYMGDYNRSFFLYQPSPALGVIFRYNLNKYYSLRLSASYSGLQGNYSSLNQYLPGNTGSFFKQLIESEGLCEINFISFNTRHLKKDNFSPYVILGIGGASVDGEIIPHFPFGVGVKYCIMPRITLGWEWRLSKTLNDKIDGYENVYDSSKALLHNNDWFSFMGFFITFRLYNNGDTCPAYKN